MDSSDWWSALRWACIQALIVIVFCFVAVGVKAEEYKPNFLVNIVICKNAQTLLTMIAMGREDQAKAGAFMRTAMMGGQCAMFPIARYQPETIVQQWEDDGSGTPGLVTAGWVIFDGGRREQGFIWLHPDVLKDQFGIDKPEA